MKRCDRWVREIWREKGIVGKGLLTAMKPFVSDMVDRTALSSMHSVIPDSKVRRVLNIHLFVVFFKVVLGETCFLKSLFRRVIDALRGGTALTRDNRFGIDFFQIIVLSYHTRLSFG